jgi:exopolysaccharide biosynthesis polyprenyl glycosylphosphotransferase
MQGFKLSDVGLRTDVHPLLLSGYPQLQAAKKFSLRWDVSWVPAATLLINDLLVWPIIYFLLSQIRLTFFNSAGDLQWHTLIIPACVTVVVLHTIGAYDRRSKMSTINYAVDHCLAMATAFVISAFLLYGIFAFDLVKPSRLVFAADFAVYVAYTLLIRRWVSKSLHIHYSARKYVLIADPKTASFFAKRYAESKTPQELRIYSFNSEDAGRPISAELGLEFAGDLSQAIQELDWSTDGLIVGLPPWELDPKTAQLLSYVHFRRIPVYTLESFYEQQWRQVPVEHIGGWWAFAQESLLARDSIYDQVKRVLDFICSSVAVALLGPLMFLLAILVRLDSRGPAIFRQDRLGRDGRIFTLFKFRTMRVGSDSGSIYTARKDSRITRIGRLLRLTRLDELPQLINVLRGDMSIIGPRAEWVKCVSNYESQIPFYHYRHLVRPGITGWAQVNYSYGASESDAMEKLKFDLYYIRHYSVTLDLAIALKTLQIMASGKGQ